MPGSTRANCTTDFDELTGDVVLDGVKFKVTSVAKDVVAHVKNDVQMIAINKDGERAIKDKFYSEETSSSSRLGRSRR